VQRALLRLGAAAAVRNVGATADGALLVDIDEERPPRSRGGNG